MLILDRADSPSPELSSDDLANIHDAVQDPVWFMENVLGVVPWSRQAEFLRAVKMHRRISLRSGHKTGKSAGLVGLALWWVMTRENARVPMTSAAFHQVDKVLWKELTWRYKRAAKRGADLGGRLYRDPASGLILPNGNDIFGFSTNEPERAAGISAANILYIIDEASGVPEQIFEAIEGNLAGGATIILCSNPTRTTGYFFDTHHSKRQFWKTFHISSEESPNVTGEASIPGLATREWIDEKKAMWGEESPMYQVRVAGNFPGQGTDAVIGLDLVMEARMRFATAADEGALRVGIDPARYGDDESVVSVVRGMKAYPLMAIGKCDGPQLAGHALEQLEKYKRVGDTEVRIKVDEIGLGTSPADFLNVMERAKMDNVVVVPLRADGKADNAETYANRQAEMCFRLRDWMRQGGAIPDDELLTQEMVSPTFEFDMQGRRKLRSKDYERKVLGRSPDRRNALELAIYDPTPRRRYTIGGGYIPL